MDFEAIKHGFEKKYFIPSDVKFNYDSCKYETKYSGELFEKVAVQTNNMFSVWRDACMYTSSLRAKNYLSEQ